VMNSDTNSISHIKTMAHQTVNRRDVNWIKENGQCMDNIRPGKSTIPGAGRGAFANGYMPEGSLVAPAPLLNIVDKDILTMYDDEDEVFGRQLLVNYCFGHQDSKLLFCPQSNAVLINHCSGRMGAVGECGEEGPNAKLKWSEWDPDNSEWLGYSIEEIESKTASSMRGLSLEIVATRDIKKGEEVFIDYGENWEEAWQNHVENWEPQEYDESDFQPLTSMDNSDLRTIEEQATKPYPANLQNACFYDYDDAKEETEEELSMDGTDFVTDDGIEKERNVWPCEVVEIAKESTGKTVCTVRVLQENQTIRITNYPAESITFKMRPYSSDLHLQNAFRHSPEIDDALFPNQWKTQNQGFT